VQDQTSCAGGDPGWDGDEVAAQGGPSGARVPGGGGGTGGPHQVERDRGEGEPGGVRGELPGRGVRQGAVLELGDDLFDDGVVAVVLVGLNGGRVELVTKPW